MPPQYANVPLVFARGLNTKADPKTVQADLLELENATFTKIGTLTTRYGYDTLGRSVFGSGVSLSSSDGLAAYGEELVQFGTGRVYSYASSGDTWMDRGIARSCLVTERDVVRNTYQQTNPDVADVDGYRMVAWEDSRGGVRVSVYDTVTGAYVIHDAQISATGTKVRCVGFGSDLVVFWADGGNLYYARYTPLSGSTSAPVNVIATLKAASNHYDVCVSGGKIIIAWNKTGATEIDFAALDSTYTLSAALTRPDDANNCVALAPDSTAGEFWVVWNGSAGQVYCERRSAVTLVPLTAAGLSLEGVTAARISAAVTAANGTLTAFYEIAGASNNLNRVRTNTMAQDGTVGTAASCRRGVGLVGRAFAVSGIVYVPIAHESPSATALQSTVFVVDSSGTVFARAFAGETGGLRSASTTCSVVSATDGLVFAATRKGELVTESGVTFTRVGISTATLDFSTTQRFQTVEAAGVLHIVGGALQMYDGVAVVEHGFHLYPEGLTSSVAAAAGSLSAGAYQWKAVYEWTDRTGRIHRSAPSPALSYTAAANDQVTVTVPTLRLTGKADVRVVLYRTLANGSTFYRVTSPTSPTLNDTTTDTVSIVDGASDSSISVNEFLYTTGDVLDHIPPGACAVACNYRGRLVVAGLSDPLKVAYSKVIQEGEPAAFNDVLTFSVDALGGPITAIAPLDDKLIIFKSTAIFVIAGNGPNATGQGSDYGDPQLVTNDVGSVGPVVAQTPMGLMFKSGKGIYLLDRAMGVKYVGDRVEAYNSLTVRGATVVPNTNQVRFVTDSTRALVYDYAFDQWATFTNYGAVDCDVWGGAWVHVRSDGTVCKENTSSYRDGSQAIEMYGVTGWIQVADMQGFQRVQRLAVLGDYYSAHTLEVQAGYDFSPAWRQVRSFDMTTLFGSATYGSSSPYGTGVYGGPWAPYEVSLHLAQQKCTSVRFSFRVRQAGTGAGASVTAMTVRVGTKAGLNKLGSTKRY